MGCHVLQWEMRQQSWAAQPQLSGESSSDKQVAQLETEENISPWGMPVYSTDCGVIS